MVALEETVLLKGKESAVGEGQAYPAKSNEAIESSGDLAGEGGGGGGGGGGAGEGGRGALHSLLDSNEGVPIWQGRQNG